MNNNYS